MVDNRILSCPGRVGGRLENKEDLNMNCFYCKGEMEHGFTKFILDLGHCVVIVKNVPAMVCKQCGEKVFDDGTMERLEQIVDSVKHSLVQEVAIVVYSDKAA